ncbi:hypothetical protein D3C87_768480 [compost metagenome]
MTSTLQDFGRQSEKHGEIPFFYGFPFRFWFGQHQIAPEDVNSWCTLNAVGYYKVYTYVHKDSKRVSPRSKVFESKVVYVDKIYLQDPRDAAAIKEAFDVRSEKVMHPRMKALRKRKAKKDIKTVAA